MIHFKIMKTWGANQQDWTLFGGMLYFFGIYSAVAGHDSPTSQVFFGEIFNPYILGMFNILG
jgi:hypothetical protein